MAPKERSISPTTITRVSPSAMIATELMPAAPKAAQIEVGGIGLDDDEARARPRSTAANSPPMRRAASTVAWPAAPNPRRGRPARQSRPNSSPSRRCLLERIPVFPHRSCSILVFRIQEKAVSTFPGTARVGAAARMRPPGERYFDRGSSGRVPCAPAATPSLVTAFSVWRVGQDDAVLQELRAGGAAEGRLVGPALVELRRPGCPSRCASSCPLDDVPADGEDLAGLSRLSIARSACSAPMSTFSMNWTSGLADRNER